MGGTAQGEGVFGFGGKVGVSFAATDYKYDLSLTEDMSRDWRSGFMVGAIFEYKFLPFASLRPEFAYVQKGSKFDIEETTEAYPEGTGNYIEMSERIDYLSLQLLGKVRVPGPGPHPYLLAGPRLDVKLKESTDVYFSSAFDQAKSTVFGGTFGAGFAIPVSPLTNVIVEFEYYLDFGDAVNETAVTVTNKSLSVAAGVTF